MASPEKSPKVEPPSEEVPSFEDDPDVDMAYEQTGEETQNGTTQMNVDGAADGNSSSQEERVSALENTIQNSQSVPVRKDVSLREFLSRMDDYSPIIPDAVVAHALTLAGLPPPSTSGKDNANATPLHLSRLLALATQKFVADLAADAYQYSRMRSGALTSNTLSAMSNPGAAMMNSGGQGQPGGPAEGGAGNKQADKSKQAGQHVLGLQRPGYGGGGQGSSSNRTVLTIEDVGQAAGEYGVNVKRGEFYR